MGKTFRKGSVGYNKALQRRNERVNNRKQQLQQKYERRYEED